MTAGVVGTVALPAVAAVRVISSGLPTQVGEFPDGRHFEVVSRETLKDGALIRYRLALNDGQVAVVDSALSEMASDPPKEAVPVAELSAPESTGLVVGLANSGN